MQLLFQSADAKSESHEFENQNEEKYNEKQGSWVYKEYFTSGANACTLTLLALVLILAQFLTNSADYWLSYWTSKETEKQKYLATNCSYNEKSMRVLNINASFNDRNISLSGTQDEQCNAENNSFLEKNLAIYVYSGLIGGCILVTILRSIMFLKMSMKSSRNLHNKMFYTLIRTPMRFFDINPSGRILNRFSRDIGAIDEILPRVMLETVQVK